MGIFVPSDPVIPERQQREDGAENAISSEIFARELARRSTVGRVIGSDRIDAGESVVVGQIFEQSAPDRIEVAKPRSHCYDRSTGSKVAGAAITKPAAIRPNVD